MWVYPIVWSLRRKMASKAYTNFFDKKSPRKERKKREKMPIIHGCRQKSRLLSGTRGSGKWCRQFNLRAVQTSTIIPNTTSFLPFKIIYFKIIVKQLILISEKVILLQQLVLLKLLLQQRKKVLLETSF